MRLSRMVPHLRNIPWAQMWYWSRRELTGGIESVWQFWERQQKPLWTDEYKPKDLLLLPVITTYPWPGMIYALGTLTPFKGVGENL